MSTKNTPISTQYDLAKRVLAVLAKQKEYFAARRSGNPSAANLLRESIQMEKDLREECESVIRKVDDDMARLRAWNSRNGN